MKVAFFGNSCTGKTTCLYSLSKALKLKKRNVSNIADLAREVAFDPSNFDTDPYCFLSVLFKQAHSETVQVCKRDSSVIVIDKTVYDWFLYYLWACDKAKTEPMPSVADFVYCWLESYDIIFALSHDVPYVFDGFRPEDNKQWMEMNNYYQYGLEKIKRAKANLKLIEVKGSVEDRAKYMEEHGVEIVLK